MILGHEDGQILNYGLILENASAGWVKKYLPFDLKPFENLSLMSIITPAQINIWYCTQLLTHIANIWIAGVI